MNTQTTKGTTMSTSKMIYGQQAYEGFARAIGATLGLKVNVDAGANACIDKGGTIYLPAMNTYQTADEFAVTCGTIVHELAHQFYRTHLHIDASRGKLEHDCWNAVVDVADETWVDAYLQTLGNVRPGELLTAGNAGALKTQKSVLSDWTNPDTHAWKVLVTGIIAARLPKSLRRIARWWVRHTTSQASALGVDVRPVFSLLRRARKSLKYFPRPTSRRFRLYADLAKRIAAILAPFAPPASAPSPTSMVPVKVAADCGATQQPAGTTLATDQDGEATATAPAKGAGGTGNGSSSGVEFDADAFAMTSPAIAKIAQRIANDGDGLAHVGGLSSGSRLGDAYRLATDGLCLARWDETDNADGVSVSVLLDCSGSMRNRLAECAGIARAFVTGMRQAGAVQAIAFGSVVRESDDFAKVENLGCTATHDAIEKATEWLAPRAGKRWIVCITDGDPDSQSLTDCECTKAAAAGIQILAVGLDCNILMPFAKSVTASDPTHLAIELEAAAQTIEGA